MGALVTLKDGRQVQIKVFDEDNWPQLFEALDYSMDDPSGPLSVYGEDSMAAKWCEEAEVRHRPWW